MDRHSLQDRDLGLETRKEGGSPSGHERPLKRRRRDYHERETTRSRSPDEDKEEHRRRDGHSHRRGHRRHSRRREQEVPDLPFGARQLSRNDLTAFRPLFAHYLELQKRLDIASLDETELRGRWKSFLGKWNRAELAEGWYDPELFQRLASDARPHQPIPRSQPRPSAPYASTNGNVSPSSSSSSDADDDYGPPPPPPLHGQSSSLSTPSSNPTPGPHTAYPGPTIPSRTDLALRDEEALHAQQESLAHHRLARRAHRADQKALLDELVPRADAGTRERKLEKRREVSQKLKGFKEDKEGGQMAEVGEGELMGGEGDSLEEYKSMVRKREEGRRERLSRRDEMERARRAEREEKVRAYREKEEKVIGGLREIARARFG
ncbi:hypothetical protein MFIFM68171_06145 [Madurella fahalii]|uniref:Uncharacterized protein n=1 Tax=Madurella fahalii TaxID=1157608 RepID=A0ABQ0GDT5_9PEZI